MWGLEPRFEPGDVVARGFADLGFEEFQVLPGPKLLSLTAGSTSQLPIDHATHFFWIPSVDESIEILEKLGAPCVMCHREDGRDWVVQAQHREELEVHRARVLHEALLRTLLAVFKSRHKEGA